MDAKTLRRRHSTFTYEKFDIAKERGHTNITFSFSIAPNIFFSPTISIPTSPDAGDISVFAFNLGLVESISYWKATCSPQFVVRAGGMDDDQIVWWRDLLIHGLGEFFYRNKIDFTADDFVTVSATGKRYEKQREERLEGDLILNGGGKDSLVTMELLSKLPGRKQVFMLNPTSAAQKTSKETGFGQPLIARRTIDPTLLELNAEGYLNGHTPFSALLAFLGTTVAWANKYQHVIASNEASAGEINTRYRGLEVNHQYSKSVRFETMFRDYSRRYIHESIEYFSFLRPIGELEIAKIFSRNITHDHSFVSCNINHGKSWCGKCAKCAFTYLILSPFLSPDRLRAIFGKNLFDEPLIQKHIMDLVGLTGMKPFDCVGTKEESIEAVMLHHEPVHPFIARLKGKLGVTKTHPASPWNDTHYLPSRFAQLLKQNI